jgi:hypothetical protein
MFELLFLFFVDLNVVVHPVQFVHPITDVPQDLVHPGVARLSFGLNVLQHLTSLPRLLVPESLEFGPNFGQNSNRIRFGFFGDGLDFVDGLKDLVVHGLLHFGYFLRKEKLMKNID